MKKVYLFLLLFFTVNLFSQPRTNEIKLQFEKVSNSLNEATGWKFDSLKREWIESKKENGINRCDEVNFYSMFFTKLQFENKVYYMINIPSLAGTYQHSTMKDKYYQIKKITSYLLDEKEYNNLKNYESGISYFFEIRTYINDEIIGEKELSDLRDNVVAELRNNKPMRKNSSDRNLIRIKKEGGDLIRFILPLNIEDKSYEKNWEFDKKYFEVSKKDYDKMFE
nr:hypothetical protein [uncultured Flavobacterium sp.]